MKIKPGVVFSTLARTWTITPIWTTVTVVWVDDLDVHYRWNGETRVMSAPIERFKELTK